MFDVNFDGTNTQSKQFVKLFSHKNDMACYEFCDSFLIFHNYSNVLHNFKKYIHRDNPNTKHHYHFLKK